eukprot:CAMPEP_0174315880 /NCGR_PEP_ID=MMETSP0810-20121108/6574_1 /TAXON_ID=73025 ORGANISM="Eutreptiella gymnastica-like, Strain CCMP1594" /NCGR_SAMPLE_ID=MMETSP0810 /ASSEMBLY_ACC=CAM_ASM_000659 /LENGTH=57 /DNA_ID=CAMNT_0015425399 /DNA_START=1398 /DNA_END=1568 /DNA_ORIENTATION=+
MAPSVAPADHRRTMGPSAAVQAKQHVHDCSPHLGTSNATQCAPSNASSLDIEAVENS